MFVEAIFSCLNLKTDDGFLPYNMPKVFNKLDMASQALQLPEMNLSQFCPQSIFGNNVYCMLEWNLRPLVGAFVNNFFRSLE